MYRTSSVNTTNQSVSWKLRYLSPSEGNPVSGAPCFRRFPPFELPYYSMNTNTDSALRTVISPSNQNTNMAGSATFPYKKILVLGSTSGIGNSLASRFVEKNVYVIGVWAAVAAFDLNSSKLLGLLIRVSSERLRFPGMIRERKDHRLGGDPVARKVHDAVSNRWHKVLGGRFDLNIGGHPSFSIFIGFADSTELRVEDLLCSGKPIGSV